MSRRSNVATSSGLGQCESQIRRKRKKRKGEERDTRWRRRHRHDSRDRVIPVFVFLELLLIKNTNDCNEQHDVLVLFLGFLLYSCHIHMD